MPRGVVANFDALVGLGVVRGDDGLEFPFHCVAISDGTRTIDPGTVVRFETTPRFGRFEAARIEPA